MENEVKKSNKGLYAIITILCIAVLGLGGFIVYDKFIKEDIAKNKNKEVSCSDCVTTIDLFEDGYGIERKILLNGKVLKIKEEWNEERETQQLIIGNKSIANPDPYKLHGFSKIFVIDNEVLMIQTMGSNIRTVEYFFLDSDLNRIEVDMTLDVDYPHSMKQVEENDVIVNGNTIHVKASRLSFGDLEVEEDGYTPLCDYSTLPHTINQENFEKHKGELVSAEYEMTYLGNNKFSKFKKVKENRFLTDYVCN